MHLLYKDYRFDVCGYKNNFLILFLTLLLTLFPTHDFLEKKIYAWHKSLNNWHCLLLPRYRRRQ